MSKTNKSLVSSEKLQSTRDLIYILNCKIKNLESMMNENNAELQELILAELRSIEQMLNDAFRTDALMTPLNVKVVESAQTSYIPLQGQDINGRYWTALIIPETQISAKYLNQDGLLYTSVPRGFDFKSKGNLNNYDSDVGINSPNKNLKVTSGVSTSFIVEITNDGKTAVPADKILISFYKSPNITLSLSSWTAQVGIGGVTTSPLEVHLDNTVATLWKGYSSTEIKPGESIYANFNLLYSGTVNNSFFLSIELDPSEGVDEDSLNNSLNIQITV